MQLQGPVVLLGARAPASPALKRRYLLSPGEGGTHRPPQPLPSWVWLLGIYSPDAQSVQLAWGQEVGRELEFAVLAPSLVLPAVTPPHPCQAVLPPSQRSRPRSRMARMAKTRFS